MKIYSSCRRTNIALQTLSIGAFSQAANWQQSLAIAMASQNIDIVMMNSLLTCCARVARWQEALQICSRLVSYSLRASVVTFNAVLSACAVGQQWQLAINLIEDMVDQRLTPDSFTWNSSLLLQVSLRTF